MLGLLRRRHAELGGAPTALEGKVSMSQYLGTALTSDTTHAAPKGLRLLLDMAKEAGIEEHGAEAFAALPTWKKDSIVAGCMNHILVLPIVEYLRLEKTLNAELAENLEKLPYYSRARDVGLDELMRSFLKLFATERASGTYAKGDRAEFLAYMRRSFPDEAWISAGRGELGSRFLWVLVAAWSFAYHFEDHMLPYLMDTLEDLGNTFS